MACQDGDQFSRGWFCRRADINYAKKATSSHLCCLRVDAQCSGGDTVRCKASLSRMLLSLAELVMGRQRRESECQFLPPSVKPSRPTKADSYLEEGEQ